MYSISSGGNSGVNYKNNIVYRKPSYILELPTCDIKNYDDFHERL